MWQPFGSNSDASVLIDFLAAAARSSFDRDGFASCCKSVTITEEPVPTMEAVFEPVGVTGVALEGARAGRIQQFREDTRDARIRIAREVEHRIRRTVSWCVKLVGTKQSEWIQELKDALQHVERAREAGPEIA